MMKIDRLKDSILLAALLLLFSACGTAAPSGITAAPLDPQLRSYSASVRVQVGQPTSVSASCKSGEQMIGGGFSVSDVFEYAAYIEASYPSGASTWTVTGAAPASYFDLEAEVYCVSAPVSLGTQIVQGAGGHIACSNGTQLLNGGFQGAQPVASSYPLENGWSSASSDQVYALCAGQHVTAGPVVRHSSETSYQPGGGSTNCPAGQFAAGGGFASQGALILSSALSGPHFASWSVVAGGDADVTVYALCAALKEGS